MESNVNLKRGAINNSLLDLTDNYNIHPGFTQQEKPTRRGSVGSLGRCQTRAYSGICPERGGGGGLKSKGFPGPGRG